MYYVGTLYKLIFELMLTMVSHIHLSAIPDDGRYGVYYEQEDIGHIFCGFLMVESAGGG